MASTQELMKQRKEIIKEITQDKHVIQKGTPLTINEDLAKLMNISISDSRAAAARYRDAAAQAKKELPADMQKLKENSIALGRNLIAESKTRGLTVQEEAILKNSMQYLSPKEKVAAKQTLHREAHRSIAEKREDMRDANKTDMARYDRAEKRVKRDFVDGKITEEQYRERMGTLKELRKTTEKDDSKVKSAQDCEKEGLKEFGKQINSITKEVQEIRAQRKALVRSWNTLSPEAQEVVRRDIAKMSDREKTLLEKRTKLNDQVEGVKNGELKVADRGRAYGNSRYTTKAA